jgi:hypothetical protein
MKLGESTIYSIIVFIIVYVLLAVGLRVFDVTTLYNAHMIAGLSATIIGVLLFLFFLLKKK